MTTTKDRVALTDLPHREAFYLIFDRAIRSSKMDSVTYKNRKTAFIMGYQDYCSEHGDKLSPLQYLELLIAAEPEDVQKNALIEGRNLLPSSAEPKKEADESNDSPPEPAPAPADEGDPETKKQPVVPRKGFRQKLGAVIGPRDVAPKKMPDRKVTTDNNDDEEVTS